MRVVGFFHDARPYISVTVAGPAFRRLFRIHFLIDTGAARSLINERDAGWLMVDRSRLRRAAQDVMGFGGQTETWLASPVDLIFETADGLFHTRSLAEMATLVHRVRNRSVRAHLQRMSSVLGQDLLSHYTFVQDPRTGLVILTDEYLNL